MRGEAPTRLTRLQTRLKNQVFWKSLWWDISPSPVIRAHKHGHRNRDEILRSQVCGWFYCLRVFPPSRIDDWVEDKPIITALCPACGIDSVIGSASGFPITADFLEQMRAYWFRGIPAKPE
jgi:hypothetical protein